MNLNRKQLDDGCWYLADVAKHNGLIPPQCLELQLKVWGVNIVPTSFSEALDKEPEIKCTHRTPCGRSGWWRELIWKIMR